MSRRNFNMSSFKLSTLFYIFSFCVLIAMIMIGYGILSMGEDTTYEDMILNDHKHSIENAHEGDSDGDMTGPTEMGVTDPVILWWTSFTGEKGLSRSCGEDKCFFTNNRNYKDHPKLKVFMFYGTSIKPHDLPVPRLAHHEWGLLHEESPKNVYLYSHAPIMTLFNHTCTFKRESDYPIVTQALPSLEYLSSREYLMSTTEKNQRRREGLAMISYTQSDCGTASDRDTYVENVMKLMKVDSYGQCLHNKDLPPHLTDAINGMDHKDFYQNQAQYKFTFALENGVCDDYVTEKFWRVLHLGSVPVVYGSPKIKDFLPSPKSVILLTDFNSVEDLVKYLKYLDANDEEYEKYLEWKKTGIDNAYLRALMGSRVWGIQNDEDKPSFIDSFECFVCNRIHDNLRREQRGETALTHIATVEHYGCPRPLKFDSKGGLHESPDWGTWWDDAGQIARSVGHLIGRGIPFGRTELHEAMEKIRRGVLL